MSAEASWSVVTELGDPIVLGSRLRNVREYLGFSLEEVASFLGVTAAAIADIEAGRRTADAAQLHRLAALYHRPVRDFAPADGSPVIPLPRELINKVAAPPAQNRDELALFADFLRAKKQAESESAAAQHIRTT